jgi:hypothetical protein
MWSWPRTSHPAAGLTAAIALLLLLAWLAPRGSLTHRGARQTKMSVPVPLTIRELYRLQ